MTKSPRFKSFKKNWLSNKFLKIFLGMVRKIHNNVLCFQVLKKSQSQQPSKMLQNSMNMSLKKVLQDLSQPRILPNVFQNSTVVRSSEMLPKNLRFCYLQKTSKDFSKCQRFCSRERWLKIHFKVF